MILLRNIRLSLDEDNSLLPVIAAGKLHTSKENIRSWKLVKRSLDARRKDDLHYVCSIALELHGGEEKILRRCRDAEHYEEPRYEIPVLRAPELRPVVVGFGPAGMYAALVLAKAGLRPIVIERGHCAEERRAAVEAFRNGGRLDPENNVQFGEGGAGTFSDGKLNTGVKDRRMAWMLAQFAEHGAPEHIRYDAKPHIGTDVLIEVVQNFRRDIISLGGEVRFNTKFKELVIKDGKIYGIIITAGGEDSLLPCENVILAIGHSARDSFETLLSQGIPMQPKPFSMGVRIEHKQSMVDLSQYGRERGTLPAADYSLNVHLPDGTSAYTFCMCPGGQVFAAASEEGGVVTNGMSYSARDGENANSALLVTLHTEDFPDRGVLSGMYWQREIEQAAYNYGGGNYLAPAQLVGDFLAGRASAAPGEVTPSYTPGVVWGDICAVLPPRITDVIRNALPELGKKLKGFDSPDAVMTAPETRSSSPVRIMRGEDFSSEVSGLFPCGEGAGYAGGISSAALDGMRCAEAVIRRMEG